MPCCRALLEQRVRAAPSASRIERGDRAGRRCRSPSRSSCPRLDVGRVRAPQPVAREQIVERVRDSAGSSRYATIAVSSCERRARRGRASTERAHELLRVVHEHGRAARPTSDVRHARVTAASREQCRPAATPTSLAGRDRRGREQVLRPGGAGPSGADGASRSCPRSQRGERLGGAASRRPRRPRRSSLRLGGRRRSTSAVEHLGEALEQRAELEELEELADLARSSRTPRRRAPRSTSIGTSRTQHHHLGVLEHAGPRARRGSAAASAAARRGARRCRRARRRW